MDLLYHIRVSFVYHFRYILVSLQKKPLCIQWLFLNYSPYVLLGSEEAAELSEEFP